MGAALPALCAGSELRDVLLETLQFRLEVVAVLLEVGKTLLARVEMSRKTVLSTSMCVMLVLPALGTAASLGAALRMKSIRALLAVAVSAMTQ